MTQMLSFILWVNKKFCLGFTLFLFLIKALLNCWLSRVYFQLSINEISHKVVTSVTRTEHTEDTSRVVIILLQIIIVRAFQEKFKQHTNVK